MFTIEVLDRLISALIEVAGDELAKEVQLTGQRFRRIILASIVALASVTVASWAVTVAAIAYLFRG